MQKKFPSGSLLIWKFTKIVPLHKKNYCGSRSISCPYFWSIRESFFAGVGAMGSGCKSFDRNYLLQPAAPLLAAAEGATLTGDIRRAGKYTAIRSCLGCSDRF